VTHGAIKGRPEGGTMKALAWFAANDVRLIDAPIPDVIEDQDVVLKVTGTTICGSDLHLCELSTPVPHYQADKPRQTMEKYLL
jgi:threonine dehydrogenase-like Zn-dependent dehydrogenase